jgi:hypothetical protein
MAKSRPVENKKVASESSAPSKRPHPVVTLTAKQSETLAGAITAVELRDSSGKTLGYFMPRGSRYFTAGEMADLSRRASDTRSGRPLAEILRDAEQSAAAQKASAARSRTSA